MEEKFKVENKDQSAFAMCMFDGTSGATLIEYGLSKREYFAAKALQGLMVQAIAGSHNANSEQWNKERAKFAVDMADAVLRALEEK